MTATVLAVFLLGSLGGYGLVELFRWLERRQSERDPPPSIGPMLYLCPECLGYHEWPFPEASACRKAQEAREK